MVKEIEKTCNAMHVFSKKERKQNMACFMLENGYVLQGRDGEEKEWRDSGKEKEIEKEKEKEASEKPTTPLYPLPQEDEYIGSRRLLENGNPLALQNKIAYMSAVRHLSCMAVLLSQSNLAIERCTVLNQSTLMPTSMDGEPHDCLSETEKKVMPRTDLPDIALPHSVMVMFVDGSCKKNPNGTNSAGYAVVILDETIPHHYSAQAAEIVALTEACKTGKDKDVTIYTGSNYAFSCIHNFAQQWKKQRHGNIHREANRTLGSDFSPPGCITTTQKSSYLQMCCSHNRDR